MADLAQKKGSFIRRYVAAIEGLLAASELMSAMNGEWDANGYATGASPPENNITDADLTPVAPWITAVQLNEAEGASVAVGNTVTAQRGYLEAIRGS
jgi:hypothetical protein